MKKLESFVLRMLVVVCGLLGLCFLEAFWSGELSAYLLVSPSMLMLAYGALRIDAALCAPAPRRRRPSLRVVHGKGRKPIHAA